MQYIFREFLKFLFDWPIHLFWGPKGYLTNVQLNWSSRSDGNRYLHTPYLHTYIYTHTHHTDKTYIYSTYLEKAGLKISK